MEDLKMARAEPTDRLTKGEERADRELVKPKEKYSKAEEQHARLVKDSKMISDLTAKDSPLMRLADILYSGDEFTQVNVVPLEEMIGRRLTTADGLKENGEGFEMSTSNLRELIEQKLKSMRDPNLPTNSHIRHQPPDHLFLEDIFAQAVKKFKEGKADANEQKT